MRSQPLARGMVQREEQAIPKLQRGEPHLLIPCVRPSRMPAL